MLLALLLAQVAAAACPATPAPLPPEYAGWATRDRQTAAASLLAADSAVLALGRRADVTLLPIAGVSQTVAPGHAPAPGSFGGLLSFTVAQPGTYRVVLDAGAWIEVVRDNKALPSSAHAHGPACTDLRKMVEFGLTPGRYLLEVSGAPAAQLAVMVSRLR